MRERLEADEMPPERGSASPRPRSGGAILAWIGGRARPGSPKNAGDPGRCLARRLSNAELDYTIRDLTGVDIRPTREFPVDPGQRSGIRQFRRIAGDVAGTDQEIPGRRKADRRSPGLQARGLRFAPEPAVTDTDRDKYWVQRIIDFYQRHQVDYADYFLAAWRFQAPRGIGKPRARLHEFATEAG